jgi:hypothetical protein
MAKIQALAKIWAQRRAESVMYRIAGLPVAIGALFAGSSDETQAALRALYSDQYWRPESATALGEMLTASLLWPLGLIAAAAWFGWTNAGIVRERCGKSWPRQFGEQLRAYFTAGILPPWYYMFELYGEGSDFRSFINRFETKQGYYSLIRRRRPPTSNLCDKVQFAAECKDRHLNAVPVVATAIDGDVRLLCDDRLPEADLFVKPISAAGGTGAERWDYAAGDHYRGSNGELCDHECLLERLRQGSFMAPRLVQPRVVNCAELRDINNGALSTVRVLTCLDQRDRPEVIAAVMRMAVGKNHRVDNIHAGGIAAPIDLATRRVGAASNLGMDARLGWIDRHPDTGGRIRDRIVPGWAELRALAERAHRAFDDRVMVGWDIAPTADGPIIVEGNSGPDVDLMQRPARCGMANGRFGKLLLHHLTH